jgi:hypothetical protein
VRRRFLAKAVKQANEALAETRGEPIRGATPHSLRRTFISLLLADGADVPYVMAQAGHSDSKMTLSIYGKVIESKTDHGASVDELVFGGVWAQKGTNAGFNPQAAEGVAPSEEESPCTDEEAADGIRTHDLLHGKQTL